jgi:hypothetical protein
VEESFDVHDGPQLIPAPCIPVLISPGGVMADLNAKEIVLVDSAF